MRVTIDHEEGQRKTGWIGGKEKIYIVKVGVQFTDEERHVIETTPGLDGRVVLELPNWEEPDKPHLGKIHNISVGTLLQSPFSRRFQTIAHARIFVLDLKEKLPHLKSEIRANTEIPPDEKHETFEL